MRIRQWRGRCTEKGRFADEYAQNWCNCGRALTADVDGYWGSSLRGGAALRRCLRHCPVTTSCAAPYYYLRPEPGLGVCPGVAPDWCRWRPGLILPRWRCTASNGGRLWTTNCRGCVIRPQRQSRGWATPVMSSDFRPLRCLTIASDGPPRASSPSMHHAQQMPAGEWQDRLLTVRLNTPSLLRIASSLAGLANFQYPIIAPDAGRRLLPVVLRVTVLRRGGGPRWPATVLVGAAARLVLQSGCGTSNRMGIAVGVLQVIDLGEHGQASSR